MGKIAIFFDAGYFWVQTVQVIHGAKNVRESVSIDYAALRQEVLDLARAQFPNAELLRVYWYDGPGPAGAKAESHLAIEELDDFKLRLGTRNGAGAQKAVDGLIIADIIGLAQTKAISEALVVSGDADLTPGVIAAQGLGLRVHLLSMGPANATSPYLRAEVDYKTHWADAVVEKFSAKCELPAKAPVKQAARPAVAKPTKVVVEVVKAAVVVAPAGPLPDSVERAEGADPISGTANMVFQRLDPDRDISVNELGLLPKKVDARLLAAGREAFGRILTEEERLAVREEFKRLLATRPGAAGKV